MTRAQAQDGTVSGMGRKQAGEHAHAYPRRLTFTSSYGSNH
jgi:hypothetical protein